MATAVWKGHLTFGLVSIPVKLYRAARAEKVSFRQLHGVTGTRVRQALIAEPLPEPSREPGARRALGREAVMAAPPRTAKAAAAPEPEAEPQEISRSELVKGYEYARDQYVTLSKDELAAITPQTAREMHILEFVELTEVDPLYFETSYYAAPDKGGERAYALLLEGLRKSGLVGLAQIAMHNREHVVVIRPGRTGIVMHTMFYESEVRSEDEYRADMSGVEKRELDLALLLIGSQKAAFEPSKYRDSYREKLEALIQAKISGEASIQAPARQPAPVVNILEALQKSLETAGVPQPKPPAKEQAGRPAQRRTARK